MPPDISEIVKNWVEAFAIIIGGIWTFYLFVLKKRFEIESLDGDLKIDSNDLSNASVVVTVRALWNNRGKSPIELNTKEILVSAYSIPQNLSSCPLNEENRQHLQLVTKQNPYETYPSCILEPKTESTLRAHFVLPKGPVYLFRWELTFLKGGGWFKEIVWASK